MVGAGALFIDEGRYHYIRTREKLNVIEGEILAIMLDEDLERYRKGLTATSKEEPQMAELAEDDDRDENIKSVIDMDKDKGDEGPELG